jgi:uncharacterized protein (TIGR02466 family)
MIKEIFPIKIYEVEYPDYADIHKSLLAEVKSYFDADREKFSKHRLFNNAYSLEGTKEGEFRDLHEHLKHRELINFIQMHLKQYWKELGYTDMITPSIVHMWANLSPKGGNIIQHNHNPFEIAGTFYIDASPDMGCLALVNPLEMVLGRLPLYDNKQESKQGRYFFDHLVEPKPGKLVLFPGWLYHKTQINTTNKERIVLGLNSGLSIGGGK